MTDDGGQAFPRAAGLEGASFCNGAEGMTLLDWFAGQALAGMLASGLANEQSFERTARNALNQARAMIEARKES